MIMDGSAGGGEAEGFEEGGGPAEGESLTQMEEFVKTVGRKEAEAKVRQRRHHFWDHFLRASQLYAAAARGV